MDTGWVANGVVHLKEQSNYGQVAQKLFKYYPVHQRFQIWCLIRAHIQITGLIPGQVNVSLTHQLGGGGGEGAGKKKKKNQK